jgi:hypothetical protein
VDLTIDGRQVGIHDRETGGLGRVFLFAGNIGLFSSICREYRIIFSGAILPKPAFDYLIIIARTLSEQRRASTAILPKPAFDYLIIIARTLSEQPRASTAVEPASRS